MKTIDIHTHLLNPAVVFKKTFDRLGIAFFAKTMGFNPLQLLRNPFEGYVQAMIHAVTTSQYVQKICLCPVDSCFDSTGREIHRDNTVCSHTEDVLTLWRHYPDTFIPFFSVNPLRQNALDLIDEYCEKGCKGAKFLQNYWNIDLNDKKFIPYYEKLKNRNIPLIIHTGSEFTVPSHKKYEKLDVITLPLTVGVTVITAHMASGSIKYKVLFLRNFSHQKASFDPDYFTLLDMLRTYPNLYADISAILSPLKARVLRHLSKQYPIHQKILFGTDYPVPFSVTLSTLDLSWHRKIEINNIPNPFDRYMSVILEYFSGDSEIFTNYQKVLNISSSQENHEL
jgi:predicted TIM-barrel fold metal-dependent hydrolase